MIGDSQLVLPPERAAIYADKEWRLSMLKAVQRMVCFSASFPCHMIELLLVQRTNYKLIHLLGLTS